MTSRAFPSFAPITIVFACAAFTGRVAAQGRAGDAPPAGEPSWKRSPATTRAWACSFR